ncbi:hypothetical protein QBC46DRAFT_346131 [Diplogelasinospora grovesii]|uniref:Uncharacterized protein n=1 Tax=Diplogelasinospora grovesii TaxID=303347 RepID=A0AAN6MYL4_9PEZI|nr:hypothetical protein QBC46DRAFT_346131 [Diplogelasinospora grovesii]
MPGTPAACCRSRRRPDKKRKRALAAWNRYREKFQKQLDPVEFWVDLCKNESEAKAHCQTFLQLYVKASKRKRLALGPEEHVTEQGQPLDL